MSNRHTPLQTTATTYRVLSANTTNDALVKTGGRALQSILVYNTGTIAFVKLYNKATTPTVGTDTPIMTIPVTATTGQVLLTFPAGISFDLGIGIGITGAIADNDTTAVAANQVTVNLQYV